MPEVWNGAAADLTLKRVIAVRVVETPMSSPLLLWPLQKVEEVQVKLEAQAGGTT